MKQNLMRQIAPARSAFVATLCAGEGPRPSRQQARRYAQELATHGERQHAQMAREDRRAQRALDRIAKNVSGSAAR